MIVWEADYKPFGESLINSNSEVVNNFRFPGQYYDQETGLHYNYHRYYDPKTGRYLRPDPAWMAGGINLYIYASLNPINFIDPWGLFRAPPFGDAIGYNIDFGGPGQWSSSSLVYKQPPVDLQDYVMLTFSGNVFGEGFEICEGIEQKTLTFFDLGGASINLYLGILPSSEDLASEIGLGLGKYLGIGHFFGNPDAVGNMQFGGIVFHFGLGVGTPVYISGTFPEGVDPLRGQYDAR
jgi:RHS repeat-associated protein